jgi:hypothetical protein
VFAVKHRRRLVALGVLTALAIGSFTLPVGVTWALLALFVLAIVVTARRNRRDLRVIAEKDWRSLSPHGQRALTAVIRQPGAVGVDDAGATRTLHNGRVASIRWADIESVSVNVLPRRFHQPDVLISLRGKEGSGFGLVMPYDETPLDFLVQLQTLPGLDADRISKVLQAKPVGKTLCWSREA